MERLTIHNGMYKRLDPEQAEAIYKKLRAYEDTGLEPEEIKTAVEIVKMLAKTDYPHNFQRENPWVVKFCKKITRIQEIAKLWMIETIRNREEADNGTTD